MSSFGTSAINKSNKKVAPKVVARRRPGAPASAQDTSQAPSVASATFGVEPHNQSRATPPTSSQHVEPSQSQAQDVLPTPTVTQQFPEQSNGELTISQAPSKTSRGSQSFTAAPDQLPPTTASAPPTATRPELCTTQQEPSESPAKRRRVGPSQFSQAAAPTSHPRSTVEEPLSQTLSEALTEAQQSAVSTSSSASLSTPVRSTTSTASGPAEPSAARVEGIAALKRKKRTPPSKPTGGASKNAAPTKKRPKRAPKTPATVPVEDDDSNAQEPSAETRPSTQKRTRQPRKPKGATTAQPDGETQGETDQTTKPRREPRKKAASLTETENNEAPGGNVEEEGEAPQRRRSRKRGGSSEDGELMQIDTSTMTMAQLTRDLHQGRKSVLETKLQAIDWTEVVRKRQAAAQRIAEGEAATGAEGAAGDDPTNVEDRLSRAGREREALQSSGPRLRLVNGQMVIDETSLQVDRHAEATRNESALEEIEGDDLTKRINSQTWINDNRRDPTDRVPPAHRKSDAWTVDQTDAFYAALRMFGTDFFIISKMFPPKTRRQIKLKFVREERADAARVKAALTGEAVPMDLDVYMQASGGAVLKDPKELEAELRREDEAHRSEIERQKEATSEMQRQRAAAEKISGRAGPGAKEGEAGRARKARAGKKKKSVPVGGEELEIVETVED
ncbi:hypothetical protein B0A49_00035 [Cryomyces minteri]|uniref:Myb-like domain-containing protein n=1 Tax=Cryomyces minteri TaxID=331657 RepID=A0A4U0Y136_9PEZI|nr:hypothetical protein B0A49_00035 [Cryomyces minteri]